MSDYKYDHPYYKDAQETCPQCGNHVGFAEDRQGIIKMLIAEPMDERDAKACCYECGYMWIETMSHSDYDFLMESND